MIEHRNTLAERENMLTYVYTHPRSALYRKLYGDHMPLRLASESDWEKVPLLTKELLVETPFHERLFSPLDDVHYLHTSSGTSGKNLLVIPKTRVHPRSHVDLQRSTGGGALTFLQPQHQVEVDYAAYGYQVPVIAGDPANLEASTRLAAELGIDILRSYPFLMERHIPHLMSTGLAQKIRRVVLTGERVLIEDIRRYAEFFPNAIYVFFYSGIESGGVTGTAVVSPADEKILYVPGESYYWELLDEQGAVIHEDDTEGEVVHTMLWTEHNNLPLVRYQMGDIGVRRRTADGSVRYEIMGRKQIDRIKAAKGELRVEEIERALTEVFGRPVPFEFHFYMRPNGTRKPRAILKIAAALGQEPALLAAHLEETIRISPTDTYKTLTVSGLHEPLAIEESAEFTERLGKKKRFQIHEED